MDFNLVIPCDISNINPEDNITIDMSTSLFDEDLSYNDKFRAMVIFIRNSGLKAKLDFSKCDTDRKFHFLLMFMYEKIEFKSEELAITWLDILSHQIFGIDKPDPRSILNIDEIEKYIRRYDVSVPRICQLINSLPLYAMYVFHPENEPAMDMSDFDISENNEIALCNFYQLTKYDSFDLLLNDDKKYPPLFFKTLFEDRENIFYLSRMMENLPYLNILSTMFAPEEVQKEVIKGIEESLTIGGNKDE